MTYIPGTGGGGVSSVNGTAPIESSGGVTPSISLNDAGVTYAKIQNVSATNKLLGRSTAGAGPTEEIAIGANLSITTGTLNGKTANTLLAWIGL